VRDEWGYNALAQFFANRGYAVLMPNFRGSTGYGKKFLNAGNGEWGTKMQDDLTWGVKYLVAEGIADPKRIGILGGSYGGYATLAGVAFTPDLYCRPVESAHAARGDSSLLGSRTQNHVRANGRSGYAGRQKVDGGAIAAAFRRENQDAADGGAGGQ
jgi:pimeloyl-ACP methyl ester carboxylesterase